MSDPEVLRSRFHDDGFVVLHDYLTLDEVEALQKVRRHGLTAAAVLSMTLDGSRCPSGL